MMKKILTISGSASSTSSNASLLRSLPSLVPDVEFTHMEGLIDLPLYHPEIDVNPLPPQVAAYRAAVAQSSAIIISTPEYIYNMPAVLKNALEWLTTSGELDGKKTLAITYTPHEPRGEKAMQSLLFSLTALNANVVGSLALYQYTIKVVEENLTGDLEELQLLKEAINMLK